MINFINPRREIKFQKNIFLKKTEIVERISRKNTYVQINQFKAFIVMYSSRTYFHV